MASAADHTTIEEGVRRVKAQLDALDLGFIDQKALKLGDMLGSLIITGSKRAEVDIQIFGNYEGNYPDKETERVKEIDGVVIPQTTSGLMANGVRWFDAAIYLSLPPSNRPKPLEHPQTKGGTPAKPAKPATLYNDKPLVAKYLSAVFFYVLIRGRAPSADQGNGERPVPVFIKKVLGINVSERALVDYVASFPLANLDPAWVRGMKIDGLSQTAKYRLGLGVAGYRVCSVFNLVEPDKLEEWTKDHAKRLEAAKAAKAETEDIEAEKPPRTYPAAVKVAQSFLDAGACWDFHPATRHPNVLSKYGNINKNCANLILDSYTADTLKRMVAARKIFSIPVYDDAHTNYKQWTEDLIYTATNKIFP